MRLRKDPQPMMTPLAKRDRSKYYCFPQDCSHDTEDYYDLKEHIKELIH